MANRTEGRETVADEQPITRWLPFEGGVALDANESPKAWKVLHLQYTIAIIRRGSAEWRYRDRNFTVSPGAVFICEPGEVHRTTQVHCPGDFTAMFLDEGTLPAIGEHLGFGPQPHFRPDGIRRPQLWHHFAEFRSTLVARDSETRSQALSRLLGQLVAHSETGPSKRGARASEPDLLRARRHLADAFHADPSKVIRLNAIADDLNVPYHSLIHDFSKRFGVPPYEFVNALRARRALEMIQRGPSDSCSSLASVSTACGYADASHMSRVFRKHWGLTPSAFARQVCPQWATFAKRSKLTTA